MERTKEIKRRELVFDQKPIRSNPEWKARTESRTCVKKNTIPLFLLNRNPLVILNATVQR